MERNRPASLTPGITYMLLALLLYALSDTLLKHLLSLYSIQQTTFLRAGMRALPLLLLGLYTRPLKTLLWTTRPRDHLLRCLIASASTYCFMSGFSLIPLTDAYVLSYSSALFFVILGAWFFGETIHTHRWLALIAGLIGITIALRPSLGIFQVGGCVVILGAFFAALNKILIRQLSQTDDGLKISLYSNLFLILLSLPLLASHWVSMPWQHWGLFAIIGILSASAQLAIVRALKSTPSSVLGPVDYSSFVWMTLLEYLLWNSLPSQPTLLGALFIISSNLYLIHQENRPQSALSKPS